MYGMGNVVSIVKVHALMESSEKKRSIPDSSAYCEKRFLEVMCIFV